MDSFRGEAGSSEVRMPRYVRVNPRGRLAQEHSERSLRAEVVAAALGIAKAEKVNWLVAESEHEAEPCAWAEVYACDASANLSRAEAYKDGSLYGVDAASVFAARCLSAKPGDRVLDLCCAPGAKLCTISDAVGDTGEVVGVDIAEHRLAACRTVLRKYMVGNVRLSLGDGTCWNPSAAQWFSLEPPPRGRGQRGRKKRRFEAEAEAALKEADADGTEAAEVEASQPSRPAPSLQLFDRVLVDAECTHDGSWRHLEKFRTQWGWDTLGGRVPWVRQEGLFELQVGLISNGFNLLKEGGCLIYATCSLCRRQNEDVVAELLKQQPTAALAPLPLRLRDGRGSEVVPAGQSVAPARPSLLESDEPLGQDGRYCTARFDPVTSGTSGLFVACFTKLVTQKQPG
ncbi:unnamed protein product [Polarella glacialis]|uniref:SAM-dependent MTase RsmB/NOP-type domain-containing protein n=1 Tax=Polarella glacialis TaxID=89957 RepID=A0A813JEY7_POLGL|nr:unnamed protein product [Polarella glacialis]